MNSAHLSTAPIKKQLPDLFGRNEAFPDGLEGATIINIGTFQDRSLAEGGGLVIDFQPANSDEIRRVVLGFDETAIWKEATFQAI